MEVVSVEYAPPHQHDMYVPRINKQDSASTDPKKNYMI
jgi:hypothetical protein